MVTKLYIRLFFVKVKIKKMELKNELDRQSSKNDDDYERHEQMKNKAANFSLLFLAMVQMSHSIIH